MGRTKQAIKVTRNWVNDELVYDHVTRSGKTVKKRLNLKPGQVIHVAWADGTCTSGEVELEMTFERHDPLTGIGHSYAPHDMWFVKVKVRDTLVRIDLVGLEIFID